MKTHMCLLVFIFQLFYASHAFASEAGALAASEVDVYPEGARVYFEIPAQDSISVNIPATFQKDSIRIMPSHGVQITNFNFGIMDVDDQVPPNLEELAQTVLIAKKEKDLLAAQLESIRQSIKKLDEISVPGKTSDEILEFISKIAEKRQELEMLSFERSQALEKATHRYEVLKKELDALLPVNYKKQNRLLIQTKGKGNIILSAWTNNASWRPSYRLNLHSENSTISGTLEAQIINNTGISWKGLIRLHTTMPQESLFVPKLRPLIVDFKEKEDFFKGLRKSIGTGATTMAEQKYDMTDIVHAIKGEVISSRPNILQVETFTLNGETSLVCIPELSEEAWALATINSMDKVILGGNAELYIDGKPSAHTNLTRTGIGDKVEIPFGKTPLIKVTKENLIPKEGQGWIGKGWVKKGYTITVTNGMKKDIEVTIIDRIPTSAKESIKVEEIMMNPTPHEQDEKGIITWNMQLKGSTKKAITVSYTVRFPANKEIIFR